VKQIVVLGHANCGGIRALMEDDASIKPDGFINSWMRIAAPAKEEVLARSDLDTLELRTSACEKAAVRYSLRNLMSYPWIHRQVENGDLVLIGWYYDLRSGEITNVDAINSSMLSGSSG
jgi:carbonic anhydrase